MNKKGVFTLISMLIICAMLASACGKSSFNEMKKDSSGMESNTLSYETTEESDNGQWEMYTSITINSEGEAEDDLLDTEEQEVIKQNDKIIYRMTMDLETKNFDELIEDIYNEISALKGYVESSEVSGRRYYATDQYRYGQIVARIPQHQLKNFTSMVSEKANVIREQSSSENVTLQYKDVENHKKSLQIEYDRLLELLDQSDALEEIIALESRLSSVRYELQSFESQLRQLDDLVTYSTVTLDITEVDRMTTVSEEKETVFGRIKDGLSRSIYDIWNGLKNFIVWFVVNLPHIIIWGAILWIIYYIVRKIRKRVKKSGNLENWKNDKMNNEEGSSVKKE